MSSVWRIQTTCTLGKNTVWSSLHKMSSVSRIWTKYTLGKNTMIISLQNEFCVKNSNAQNTRVQTQKHNQSLYTLHISETSVNVIICSYLRLFGISSASPSQQFLSFRMIWTANPLSVLCCYMRSSHYNSLHPLPTYPNYFLQPLIASCLLKTAHPISDSQMQAMQILVRIANSLHLDNTARFLHVLVVWDLVSIAHFFASSSCARSSQHCSLSASSSCARSSQHCSISASSSCAKSSQHCSLSAFSSCARSNQHCSISASSSCAKSSQHYSLCIL